MGRCKGRKVLKIVAGKMTRKNSRKSLRNPKTPLTPRIELMRLTNHQIREVYKIDIPESGIIVNENLTISPSHIEPRKEFVMNNSEFEYGEDQPVSSSKPKSVKRNLFETYSVNLELEDKSDAELESGSNYELLDLESMFSEDDTQNKNVLSAEDESASSDRNDIVDSELNISNRDDKISSTSYSGSEYVPSDLESMSSEDEARSRNLLSIENEPASSKHDDIMDSELDSSNKEQEISSASYSDYDRHRIAVFPKRVTLAKHHNCPYCNSKIIKFARHLETKHSNEKDVAKFLNEPKNSAARKNLISIIRNRGNFLHNIKSMSENRESLIVKRRPETNPKQVSDFLPCAKCLGFYAKHALFRHARVCQTDKKMYTRVQSASALLLPVNIAGKAELKQKVLSRMIDDPVTNTAKTDSLILLFGSHLINKYGHQRHLYNHVSQKMRELARLLIKIRELDKNIRQLSDILQPIRFDSLINAVHVLTGFNTDTGMCKIPALAMKLGHSLRKCIDLSIFQAIKADDMMKKKTLKNFKQIFDVQWSTSVSKFAADTLYKAKWNQPSLIPVAEDIKKLNSYLKTEAINLSKKLVAKFDYNDYDKLSRLILSKLILFNRRRVGETQRITIKQFNTKKTVNMEAEIFESLSDIEKQIARNFYHMEVIGKRGRKVPILMTQATVCHMNLLLKYRCKAGIPSENEYIFGRGSFSCIRGCDALRYVAKSCGAIEPHKLTSTRLRKHVATMCQILNLKEHEMDQLANFMGHDIKIHREFYRMPDDTVHLARISKLLITLENGKINKYKGKSLDEIDISIENSDESEEEEVDLTGGQNNVQENTLAENDIVIERSETRKKRKYAFRRPWTQLEINAVWRYLETYKNSNKLPGKAECMECISQENDLKTRTWTQIKDFIRNFNLRNN